MYLAINNHSSCLVKDARVVHVNIIHGHCLDFPPPWHHTVTVLLYCNFSTNEICFLSFEIFLLSCLILF